MSTILVTGASGFVGRHLVPSLVAAGHRVVALVRTPTAGEMVLGRLSRRPARAGRDADRRRHPAGDPRPGDGRRRCRRPPRRDPARLQRRCGPAPGQHRGHAVRRRRDEGGRCPASRPHGRARRRRRPGPPLRELQGEGRGARPRFGPRLDDPQAVAPVRARATASSTSSPASSGSRPGSSRCRATGSRVPADPCRRRLCGRRPRDRRSDVDRRVVRARRSALLDVPRDHPRGRLCAGQAARRSCRCRSRSSGSSPGPPNGCASRSRSRRTSFASSSSTTSGRST